MAGMIKTEMIDCLEQVEKLQSRMSRLQEEAEKEAAEEVTKKTEIEPSLKIMSDWLDKYGEMIDEIECRRVIVDNYNKLKDLQDSKRCRGYIPSKKENELYNNREMITETYSFLQNKLNQEKRQGGQSRIKNFDNSSTFIFNNKPTYFMKQYIEATHNMFLIQQKRINKLEQVIEGMNPKLLNEDLEYEEEANVLLVVH